MNSLLKKFNDEIIKHAPTILSVMGAIGTVAAVWMSSDAAVSTKEKLDETPKDISKADKFLIYAENYAPTAVMTTASLVCIFGANHINKQRIASLAGVYILSETALKEYKDKAEEIIGKKKSTQIRDEIVQDHINANPPSDHNTCPQLGQASDLTSLWYDDLSGRYFYTNAEKIRRVELEANRMLMENGFVSVNDIYDMLGIPEIKFGYDNGWQIDKNKEVSMTIRGGLTDADSPCGVLDMSPYPSSAWLSEI